MGFDLFGWLRPKTRMNLTVSTVRVREPRIINTPPVSNLRPIPPLPPIPPMSPLPPMRSERSIIHPVQIITPMPIENYDVLDDNEPVISSTAIDEIAADLENMISRETDFVPGQGSFGGGGADDSWVSQPDLQPEPDPPSFDNGDD